jgi:anion transporter
MARPTTSRPAPAAPAAAAPALILALAAALAVWPAAAGLPPAQGPAAAITVATVGFWATRALPEYLTALLFFLFAMLLDAAPAEVVFSGFASTAFWLVFGGLVLAVAVERTGLGARLAAGLIDRVGGDYRRLIAGLVATATLLAFLVPSTMGRVLMLIPLVAALADRLGFAPGSRGRAGMVLATAVGTYTLAAGILPANVPNMVMAGAVETLHGVTLRYGPYLALHFPVLGLLKAGLLIWLVLRLFPDEPAGEAAPDKPPMTPEAWRLAGVLALTLAAWATDFLHGLSPAWVALAAALACLMPGVRLVPQADFAGRVNFGSLFYVAAVLGIAALVNQSGLGAVLSRALSGWLPLAPGADAANYGSLVLLGTGVALVATMPGVPAVLTPLAGDLAAATGWPLEAVLMTQVVGFSTVVLPYQVPPVMVALTLAGVRLRDAVRLTCALAAASLLLLVPLNYVWWRLLGWPG